MKIVTDGNYCVKCHSLGDYQVEGRVTTLGPNLDEVIAACGRNYLRDWIANPQRILPYTRHAGEHTVSIRRRRTLAASTRRCSRARASQQLDGVVDLLMNFDEYARRQTSVKALVKEPAAAPAPAGRRAESPPADAHRATINPPTAMTTTSRASGRMQSPTEDPHHECRRTINLLTCVP